MQHSLSWESNRSSASQEIPRIVWNPKVHRRIHKCLTHLSLSWVNSIQSMPSHLTSWRSILILFSHLRLGLPSGLFPSDFPTETLYTPLYSPHTCYMHRLSHYSRFDHPNNIVWARTVHTILWGNQRERDHLENPGLDGRIILRWISGSGMWGYGLDWTGSG